MILIALCYLGTEGKIGSGGFAPQSISATIPFHAREKPFLNREGTAKQGIFVLLQRRAVV